MSMHTRCTHCEAVFRVTLLQLQSSSGRVRCGVCREVFDAFVHLRAADPPPDAAPPPAPHPQIDLPEEAAHVTDAAGVEPTAAPAEAPPHDAGEPPGPEEQEMPAQWPTAMDGSAGTSATSPPAGDEFVIGEITESAPDSGEPFVTPVDDAPIDATPGEADGWPSDEEEGENAPVGVAPDAFPPVRSADADDVTPALAIPAPTTRRQRWPLAAGVAAALLLLGGQAAYQFRTPIATALPALRPALESACAVAGCDVPLPQLPERLVIETSDLRALDPSRPNRVVLATTVRNSAPVAQAYPMLELSLTDARDKLTARKVFSAQDYLDTPPAKGAGLAADAEFSVRMQLDIGDIEASGYRLYLFHR